MNDISLNNLTSLLNTISDNIDMENNKPWNKLDNNIKIEKLNIFAENHGKEKKYSTKEIKLLKIYFKDCILHKNKLSKSKEVIYDKDNGIIVNIPGLNYNNNSKSFTIRCIDSKRVSTLKHLAPKRKTPKNIIETDANIN